MLLLPAVLVTETDHRAKIADFGLAELRARTTMSMAGTGHSAAGTPWYMAPEAFTPSRPQFSWDVYAFAMIMVRSVYVWLCTCYAWCMSACRGGARFSQLTCPHGNHAM